MKHPLIRMAANLLAIPYIMLADLAPAEPSRQITAVASFSIIGELAERVGGEHVRVSTLVGPGGDAHTYNPTPADSVAITRADVILVNGLGFDDWIRPVIRATGTTAPVLVVSAPIRPIYTIEGHHHRGHADDHTHNHAGDHKRVPDPHHWLNPENLILATESIRQEFSRIAPELADEFTSRAQVFSQELRDLDRWTRERVETIPKKNRKLVTSHDSIAYFGRRYGLRIVTTAMGSLTTEGADPNAAQMAKVVRAIKKENVPAVFFDITHGSNIMARIAEDAGVKLAEPLYTDGLGPAGSPAADIPSMIRHNVSTITTALGGTL